MMASLSKSAQAGGRDGKIVIVIVAAIGVCGCAGDQELLRQAASNQCQAVENQRKDPQFATCMQAMTLTQREDQLRWAYHSMLNLTPSDRMRRHQDIQVY